VDVFKFMHFWKNFPHFIKNYYKFRSISKNIPKSPKSIQMLPILNDFDQEAGTAGGDYFFQDLWAARKIYAIRPQSHTDIGSRLMGLFPTF
jgi:hypothetical protein